MTLEFITNEYGENVFDFLSGTTATIEGRKIEKIVFQKGRIKIVPKSSNEPVMIFRRIP